ncbi:MAG: tRNA (adenosine(37)-N6)-threonylcarbamoyltransferase complex dimerization subunit type 1 TsaB [Elusimicrobiota bacterium]|nr:tRNA (adenosine(37)-N6)-threonylcarbamoyltransferase complex dimerization subunit type 1 TsaB [Elusimicrobiota bacterium]
MNPDKVFLAIDTTTERFTVALGSGEKVYALKVIEGRRHSERLIPSIKEVFTKGNVDFDDIDAVGVCAGPGSFTGIRVGLSCAVTMGQVLEIPVYRISLLDIAGRSFSHPVIKAFGTKYYYCDYNSEGLRRGEIRIIDTPEKEKIKGKPVVPEGAELLKETDRFFNSKEEGKWSDIEPIYLMETKYKTKNAKH